MRNRHAELAALAGNDDAGVHPERSEHVDALILEIAEIREIARVADFDGVVLIAQQSDQRRRGLRALSAQRDPEARAR